MLNIRPIPRHLLPHSVPYEEFVENGRYGEVHLPPINLHNVRIDYVKSLKRTTDTESKNIKAVMYFDLVNSGSDQAFVFKEKSKITFDGMVMQVEKVNPVHAISLHHYEVELV